MTTSTRIYLIRHGQVVNHHEFRYNGHFDVGITELGVLQMKNLASLLSEKEITALFSSDLQRAYRGADIIGEGLGLKSERLAALRELYLGRWEGLTRDEAVQRFPEDKGFSFRRLATESVEGGETLADLRERVMPVVNKMIERHRGECVCCVAHGGVNRVILSDAMGLGLENFFRIEQDYGCLNIIDYFADGIKVVKLLNGGPNQKMAATKLY
ncbi:MAG: histidine phosphatase family protein [Thermodesulfobacteriota bacterium]